MKIKPMPPYYPTFKQLDKLSGKHQYFAKQLYSAGKISNISSNKAADDETSEDEE